MLIKGKVNPQDLPEARKILKKHLKSSSNANVLYGKIKKKERDYSKAIKYFQKASKDGNGEAMYEYGKLLYKGKGCQKNEKEANKYFQMSKINGYDKADKFLLNIEGNETLTTKNTKPVENIHNTDNIKDAAGENKSKEKVKKVKIQPSSPSPPLQQIKLSEDYSRISVNEFNSKLLKEKSMILSKIQDNSLPNVKKLVQYLMEFNELKDYQCFNIISNNNLDILSRFQESKPKIKIFIHFNLSQFISNHSEGIANILNEFDESCINLNYPSNNFDFIYDSILKIKDSLKDKITISIFITNTNETDQKFYENNIINYVKLDSSVNCIKSNSYKGSFSGCSSLTQITIPSSVTSIEEWTFRKCSSLAQITIPSSVIEIGVRAFEGCSSLTQITIPSSVTSIGNCVFDGCSSLTQISIPSSVKNIGYNAFPSNLKIIRI